MKYERFEDLPVWAAAVDLAHHVYVLTRDRFFVQPGDLRDQLRRAALSVSNNIAEGFERGSTAELIAFLYIARGSAGEVRSMLHFVDRCPDANHLRSQISDRWQRVVRGRFAHGLSISKTPTSGVNDTSTIRLAANLTRDSAPRPFSNSSMRFSGKPGHRTIRLPRKRHDL